MSIQIGMREVSMVKKQDVMTGLRLCKPAWFTVENCERGEQCPYHKYGHDIGGCVDHLIDDALELLQEAEKELGI